ncbi:MAG: Fic family protein [Deltaproteobacteria bacterium]|jgi:Fic family protein|nr:Fic family protein [Deltaproteobacteria bacterium]
MLDAIDSYQIKINAHRPFGPSLLPQIRDYYRVSMTYASNAIEGFSYTESETKVLLEDGLTVGGKPLRDALAVIGHAKAYDHMFSLLKFQGVTNQEILYMHSMLEGSLNSGIAGYYRNKMVFVTGSPHPFPHPDEIPSKMDDFEQWMQSEIGTLHTVEYAVLLHKRLVTIHPFEDGNGRISRLVMNVVLIQNGYLPIIVPPPLRIEYIDALKESHNDDTHFKEFMYRQEIESQRAFLRLVGEGW